MPRSPRLRHANRAPILERLEERQLLSTVRQQQVLKTEIVSSPAETSTQSAPKLHHPWEFWAHNQPVSKSDSSRLPKGRIDLRASDILAAPDALLPPSTAITPAKFKVAYGINQLSEQGQGMTIAIVDPSNDPVIASNLATYSREYGLPQMDGLNGDPTFTKATPDGTPAPNIDDDAEISLDVEWAHAIAPLANILLVESLSFNDIFRAEQYAVAQPGVSVVSNSWTFSEFAGEQSYDADLVAPAGHNPVAITVSTGDSGVPAGYPAYSPNAVAVGGTSLVTNRTTGAYIGETGWDGSGGGLSVFEPSPSFQSGLNLPSRAVPDVSSDADPNTGIAIYDSFFEGGWLQVGGTSVSAPTWAALLALSDQARIANGFATLSSAGVNTKFYAALASAQYTTDFHDVTSGDNGDAAGVGYDLVTGIGTPKAPAIVNLLSSSA